ncbi:MAG: hypothetical protein EOP04_07230 [Proteobacteria bacterium]|nr:MAG: hypothetical protein EOP04_07230 [Pseudomonadota bacterium]
MVARSTIGGECNQLGMLFLGLHRVFAIVRNRWLGSRLRMLVEHTVRTVWQVDMNALVAERHAADI